MGWGTPRRPKISNKLGNPNPREGSDGDMQVRQTGAGARLFAKLGGRWLSHKLYGNELDSQDVFVPKCWVYRDIFPDFSGGTLNMTIAIPSFIDVSNIISFSFMSRGVSYSVRNGYGLCGVVDNEGSATTSGVYELTCLLETDRNSFYVQGSSSTTGFEEEEFILTVFFK